jgi:hypothetical protein
MVTQSSDVKTDSGHSRRIKAIWQLQLPVADTLATKSGSPVIFGKD